jgi:hypothetical protein
VCLTSSTECQPVGPLCSGSGSRSLAAPCSGRVPPRYRRFMAPTGPAATLWPSDTIAGAYLFPRFFSLGPGGLRQFRYNPSLRAATITPLGPTAVSFSVSAAGAAFATSRVARHRGLRFSRLAQCSLPTARKVASRTLSGFVRRHRPRLSPAKRLLSFVMLTSVTLGLSPTGLYRLSGHAGTQRPPAPALSSSSARPGRE